MALSRNNLAAVLYRKNDLRLEERPVPKPKPNEALLQIECVGICGSDVHFWAHGRIATCIVETPMALGHEASGTVIQVGSDVKHLKPGDRVAIEPGVPCQTCSYCKEGNYHLCSDMVFCSCPPYDGTLTRFHCHPANYLFKLPNNISFEEGALLEPFSVAVHACKRGLVNPDSTVLVLGSGPIGLVTVLTARAYGASKIIVTDLVDFRLEQAKECGANLTVKIDPKEKEDATVKRILDVLGEQPSVSIDCTGIESCVRIGMLATRRNGIMVEVGMNQAEMKLPLFEAQCKEVDIRGCYRYCNDYPTALNLVATGRVNVKQLVTHHFRLEDSVQAFTTAHQAKENTLKIMIHANPNWKA